MHKKNIGCDFKVYFYFLLTGINEFFWQPQFPGKQIKNKEEYLISFPQFFIHFFLHPLWGCQFIMQYFYWSSP
jgi:hypothetical protein